MSYQVCKKVTVKHVSNNQPEMFSSYLHNLRFNSTLKKTFVMTAAQSFAKLSLNWLGEITRPKNYNSEAEKDFRHYD